MALEKPGGGAQNRRPSNYGTTVSRVLRGQEFQQAWPKPQKKRLHPATKERNEFFRQVQWAWKYNYPEFNKQLTEAVARTPLLPRDLFLSMLAGRLLNFYTPEGRMVTSVASQNNVSETLDFLSSEPGSILVRTEEGWAGLMPGALGDVLQLQGDPLLPQWGAGGGGGGATTAIPNPMLLGNLRNATGTNIPTNVSLDMTPVAIESPVAISQLKLPILGTPSGIYRPVIYDWASTADLPASTLGATLYATGPEKTLVNGPSIQSVPFDAETVLNPGRVYLIGLFKRAAAIQTSFAALANNRASYSYTTAIAEPLAVLPALPTGISPNKSFWTE